MSPKKSRRGKISDLVYKTIKGKYINGFMILSNNDIESLINKLYRIK